MDSAANDGPNAPEPLRVHQWPINRTTLVTTRTMNSARITRADEFLIDTDAGGKAAHTAATLTAALITEAAVFRLRQSRSRCRLYVTPLDRVDRLGGPPHRVDMRRYDVGDLARAEHLSRRVLDDFDPFR